MPDSSTDQIAPEVEKTVPAPDVIAAEPSIADLPGEQPTGENKGETLLDKVKDALKPKEESPASEKTDPEVKPEATDAPKKEGEEEADDEDPFTEEELSQLKSKTRRQFDRLTESNASLKAEIGMFKPKAEQFEKIVGFVEENSLSPDEINLTFDVAANLKRNPRKAYEQLKPTYEALAKMFGDILPDDLQGQVNQGYITAEHAASMAALRTDAEVAQRETQRLQQQQEKQRQSQASEAQTNAVKAEVSKWEVSSKAKDPDWSLKQPDVMQAVEFAMLKRDKEGLAFPTAAEAVALAGKALEDVNAKFARLAPRRKEIRPVTDAASTASVPRPSSALEAAKQGLAKMAAA